MQRRAALGRRTLLGLVLLLPIIAASVARVEAQVSMVRFYLVPKIGDGLTPFTAFRPKYFDGLPFSALDYGAEPVMLVAATVSDAQHQALVANIDVVAVPAALDDSVSPVALTNIQNALESANIPGQWITTAHTYRHVLRRVAQVMQVMQRYHAAGGRIFGGGVTLDTRINQLGVGARNQIISAAQNLGLDTTGIVGAMTLRQALNTLAPQLPPIAFGGEVFH